MPTITLAALVTSLAGLALIVAATVAGAQLAASTCDWQRLQRCQQDIVRDIQSASLNTASNQYAITGSGPPYSQSGSSSSSALAGGYVGGLNAPLVTESTCRLVRTNLDCLLQTTPLCYEAGYGLAQNTDPILRAKRFLEDNKCNAPDSTWQNTFCYRSTQIKVCEDNFLALTKYTSTIISINGTVCRSYLDYRQCVERHVRLSCKVSEMDMLNEYLLDKASDLAWRCPTQQNLTEAYKLSHYYSGSLLEPLTNSYGSFGSVYDQRPIPSYTGSRDKFAWEKFTSPDEQRYGISRYFGAGGSQSEVFDRLTAGGSRLDDSDCPIRASPFVRECEASLADQQRLARDSRDGNELQRRICCALYQYRDCLSRIVVDRCVDGNLNSVEILMGHRRSELNQQCPTYLRDFCSGAQSVRAIVGLPVALSLALIATIVTLRQ